jgi:hypothetical protein
MQSINLRFIKDGIMVASVTGSGSGSGISNWADSVFSKLDTKNQGYIDKSDLTSALSSVSGGDGTDTSGDADDIVKALDGDGDGKVTKSELTDAMTKLTDQLNAQFDASRVNGGGMPPNGPPPSDGTAPEGQDGSMGSMGGMQGAGGPPPGGPHGAGGGGGVGGMQGSDGTDSTGSTTGSDAADQAADTNGDGTVSAEELAAYEAQQSGASILNSLQSSSDGSGSSSDDSGSTSATGKMQGRDSTRELAHALHLLKAYAQNGVSASGTSDSNTSSSISVEA